MLEEACTPEVSREETAEAVGRALEVLEHYEGSEGETEEETEEEAEDEGQPIAPRLSLACAGREATLG